MKKLNPIILFAFCVTCFGSVVSADPLNDWSFEYDLSGLTLSETANAGTEGAQFAAGGAGILETDGGGFLVCTQSVSNVSEVWSSGVVLHADVADVSSGVHYLRCDLEYDLTISAVGSVLGFAVVDGSGTNVAGFALTSNDAEAFVPGEYEVDVLTTNLSSAARISVIAKVDVSAQTMTLWYATGEIPEFDEGSPDAADIPIRLTSIDQLQFRATGNFQPLETADYAAVDNLRTASSWSEITEPRSLALAVHPVFSHNMVLQRDMNAPIWGRVTPDDQVMVQLDGEVVASGTADETGIWLAKINPQSNDGGLAHSLQVSSGQGAGVLFTNVVFGDVYLASGQSNMERLMSSLITGYEEEVAAADGLSQVRQLTVGRQTDTNTLQNPVLSAPWTPCSGETIDTFSSVGYFFAKSAYQETGVPVGLLLSAWGGQYIERFLSPEGVRCVPELAGMSQNQEEGGINNLYDIYNGMIAPLMPYGIRGTIWYQGESNALQEDGDLYRFKMQALMRGWRRNWGQGDFPFYFVQLANYATAQPWPALRQAQLESLSETNSGMVVTIDIGDDGDIHPANKYDTGRRLAQWALAKDLNYNRVCSGPLFRKSLVEDGKIRVIFDHAETGLAVGLKDGTNQVVFTDGALQNFEIAGSNRVFVLADAVIDKDTVVVSSPSVSDPLYVRYCYQSAPSGSNKLYNVAGFPASPFCTDESYPLVVASGSGDAVLVPGALRTITADTPADGKVFDRWIGAASEVEDVSASSTTVTMPHHALYLFASYRDDTESAYTLSVNNGYGAGTSQSGSLLTVQADAPAEGQVFDHWSGDTQTVVDVSSSVTTLRMPASNIQVTAIYRAIDTVGDGVSDSWRAVYFEGDGTATNELSASDADPDGDGMTNLEEYQAGTSPVDEASVLRLIGTFSGSDGLLSFGGVAGRRYSLERKESLLSSEWEPVVYNICGEDSARPLFVDIEGTTAGFLRLSLNVD